MFQEIRLRAFTPNGAEAWVTLKSGVNPADAAALLERMGLLPVPPDEFQRERRNEIGALVLRYHGEPDGDEVPVLDLYFRHSGGYVDRFRSMVVYLDRPEQREEIERLLGVPLDQLPFYDADTPLIRGEKPQRDNKCVVWVRGLWAVWRLNPASEEDDRAKKRLFLRWEVEGTVQVRLPGQAEAENHDRNKVQVQVSTAVVDANHPRPLDDHSLHTAVLGVWGLPKTRENLAMAAAILKTFFQDTGVEHLTRRQAIAWAGVVRMTRQALRDAFPPGQPIRMEQVRAWLAQTQTQPQDPDLESDES